MAVRSLARVLLVGSMAALACGSPTPGAEQRSSPPAAPAFTNLQVLPKDLSVEQLLAEMQSFEVGLGKDCDYCHVVVGTVLAGGPGTLPPGFDFASDDKPAKRITRQMIVMARAIDAMTSAAVGKPAGETERMRCFNCHRGIETPPLPLRDILERTTAERGLPAAITQYRELRGKYYGSALYDFSDAAIGDSGSGTNGLRGYATQLFFAGRYDDALAWLNLNLEYYPKSTESWVTMAFVQALAKHDQAAALASMAKAIAVEPQNPRLKEQLEVLKALPP